MHCPGLALLGFLFAATAARAETFACDIASVRVFADSATLSDPPIRILAGAGTGITECYGIAIDLDHRELWVAGGTVRVFPIGAQGDVAPTRSILLPEAGLGFAVSLAVDVASNEVVVGTADGRIHTFPRLATGGPPIRTIDGTSAGVATILGIVIDRARDEVFVASLGPGSQLSSFARTATGAASPARPSLPLAAPGEIEMDVAQDELYVVSGPTIIVTKATTTLRTFQAGFVEKPYGMAMRQGREILVGDQVTADPDPIKRFLVQPFGTQPPLDVIFNGSAPGRWVWGLATTRQADCSNANTARCMFRDGLEQPAN